jgi:hypothetical protein
LPFHTLPPVNVDKSDPVSRRKVGRHHEDIRIRFIIQYRAAAA